MNNIINDVGKYHYIFVLKNKSLTLSSENKASEAKKKALNKIKPKLSSFEGKSVIKLKLSKVPEKTLKASKNSKVKGIGGPILVDIDVFEITPKLTLKISEYEDRFNTLYITDKYLEKNKKINKKHLSKIAVKAFNNKLSKSPVAVNTIDKILKK